MRLFCWLGLHNWEFLGWVETMKHFYNGDTKTVTSMPSNRKVLKCRSCKLEKLQ